MKNPLRHLVPLLLCVASLQVVAQELPTASPESVGMSTERLTRINDAISRHVEAGTIANAVTIVTRRGKVVHYEAHGYLDPAARTPMRKDALFRMASSTKPVIAVAILSLAEEGKLRLDDPVEKFIPEFAGQKVAVPRAGAAPLPPMPIIGAADGPKPQADLVAANTPITLRHLLTHTAGLISRGLGNRLAADIARGPEDTLATFIPKVGAAPLDFQPGTQWSYSGIVGFEVLGRVIEIVSGQTLDVFLKQRIFDPLNMTDTAFVIPAAKRDRMNSLWRRTAQGQWEASPPPAAFSSEVYFSGGGGLTSTARDYARFEQMLLNGGSLGNRRILAPRSVELMRSNLTDDLFRGMNGTEDGVGFGLAIAVTLDQTKSRWPRSNGSAGWEGAFGTMTWSDPREELVAVIMLQQNVPQVHIDYGNAILQAITDSNPPR